MLSPAHPLSTDDAARWARAGVPHWVPRLLLTAGWLVASALTVASGDAGPACQAGDPTICGPDLSDAAGIVLWLATPVLLLWLPPLGCLAGAGFALAVVAADEAGPAMATHGLACAATGLWMLAAAVRQRAVARRAAGGLTAVLPSRLGHPCPGPCGSGWPAAAPWPPRSCSAGTAT